MIIDTKESDNKFTTKSIDGFVLVNPSEIGVNVAYELFKHESIQRSDIYNIIERHLANIISKSANKAFEVLKENKKVIK